jgi:hypothetical protein
MPLNMAANPPHRMRPEDNIRLPPRSEFQQHARGFFFYRRFFSHRTLTVMQAVLPQHLRPLAEDA